MALEWLLHSACHVLGYPKDDADVKYERIERYPNEEESSKGLTQKVDSGFQMPLHYPRYTKEDYKKMEEWKVDLLLGQYGLGFKGTLEEKRDFAMGAFLWPDQY